MLPALQKDSYDKIGSYGRVSLCAFFCRFLLFSSLELFIDVFSNVKLTFRKKTSGTSSVDKKKRRNLVNINAHRQNQHHDGQAVEIDTTKPSRI